MVNEKIKQLFHLHSYTIPQSITITINNQIINLIIANTSGKIRFDHRVVPKSYHEKIFRNNKALFQVNPQYYQHVLLRKKLKPVDYKFIKKLEGFCKMSFNEILNQFLLKLI